MEHLKSLMEERKKLLADMRELNDRPGFGATEQDQWQRMDARYSELDGIIAREQRSARLEAEAAKPEYAPVKAAERSARGGDAAAYREAFIRSLRTGSMSELRAWSGNDNGTTNAPVPVDMQRRIVELAPKSMLLRSLASVYQAATDQQITVDGGPVTGYLVDETNTTTEAYGTPTNKVTETKQTFTRITVKDYAFACRVPITQFAINDYINGGDYFARKVAEGVYLTEEQYLMNGDGSGTASGNPAQPKGVVSYITGDTNQKHVGTGAGNTGAGVTTIATDDIISTVHKIKPRYRSNLRWLMSDDFCKAVRLMKDGSNRYLWQVSDNVPEGLTNGIAGTLYGIPVTVSEFMPTATGANACAAIVGDFSKVEIYDRGGLEFRIDEMTGLQTLTRFLQAWKRSDVIVNNTAAFGWLAFK